MKEKYIDAGLGFIAILSFVAVILIWNHFFNGLEDESQKYKEKLGFRVVIEKDTSLIVDYSIINENFILSNGQTVSFELVNKMPLLK